MKIRFLSTLAILASMTGAALAQRGVSTHIVTTVKDDSGRPVQGASVRLFGPFGYSSRRNDYSTSADRSGVADQTVVDRKSTL